MQIKGNTICEDNELWVPIKNWEGIYEISNKCKIRSLDRWQIEGGKKRFYKSQPLKLKKRKDGYLSIHLRNKEKLEWPNMHRLLAQHFIPNPDNKPFVNHINGIRDDNRLENLEWVTESENTLHAVKIGLKKVGRDNPRSIRVLQYDLIGNFIKEHDNISQAAEAAQVSRAGIIKCLKGDFKQLKGFIFKKKTERNNDSEYRLCS